MFTDSLKEHLLLNLITKECSQWVKYSSDTYDIKFFENKHNDLLFNWIELLFVSPRSNVIEFYKLFIDT